MKMVRVKNVLRILYFMMAADGLIRDEEREKFDELGRLMDDRYDSYRSSLLWEIKQNSLFSPDRETVFLLMDMVDRELKEGITDSITEEVIPGRLLVWNMLTIALCDRDYADSERRLIEEAVRKLEVDDGDFREMEHTLVAANAVEREASFLRQAEAGNPDVEYQLKNLKERSRMIATNAREQMRG